MIFLFLFGTKGISAQQKDSITVYLFLAEDCKICQYYTPILSQLHEKYQDQQIGFIGLFPNRYSTEEGIKNFKETYKVPFVLKREYYQTRTKSFNATITPEVVVYNETQKEIIYKGRIDDSYVSFGRRCRVVKNHELDTVLKLISQGSEVALDNQPAVGCYIMTN